MSASSGKQNSPQRASVSPRARKGSGSLGEKTAYRTDPKTGKRVPYTYYQAAREVPNELRLANGNRARVTGSGRTPAIAQERLDENWAKLLRGETDRRRTTKSPSSKTLAQLFTEWDLYNRRGEVSDIVAGKYEGYFRLHILPHLGKRRLSELSDRDILLLFTEILPAKTRTTKDDEKPRPLLSGTAQHNIFMALSGCLRWGVQKGYLPHSPTASVKAPRRTTKKVDVEGYAKFVQQLMDALVAEVDPDYCRWLFQFLGLRRAERLGLRWSNFHDSPGGGLLTVDSQLARAQNGSGWYIKSGTKNHHDRTIAVPEPFLSVLRAYRTQQDEWKKSPEWKPRPGFEDLIFLQPNGALVTLNRDNEEWRKTLERHSLPYWRGHINRHITATLLAEQEPALDIRVVQSILGHETESMTYYYAHLSRQHQMTSMRQYGSSVAAMLGQPAPSHLGATAARPRNSRNQSRR